MKLFFIVAGILFVFSVIWKISALPIIKPEEGSLNKSLLELSSLLLYRVKTGDPIDSLQVALSAYSLADLNKGLNSDDARKVFWINMYNAYYQIFAINDKKGKETIYTDRDVRFVDITFSLDDIEHGILRKYRWKYSLGYLPQFFPPKPIKQLAVNHFDYRIHFALNCGARSCPPIAFYNMNELDKQLEIATQTFLESETEFDDQLKLVYVTKIMQWFRGDFGGEEGILGILSRYLNKDLSGYQIKYKDYDWTPDLKNFSGQ